MQRLALFQFYTTMSMRSKSTRSAPQRKIRAVRRTSIYTIPDVSSMWGFAALAPTNISDVGMAETRIGMEVEGICTRQMLDILGASLSDTCI